LVLEHLDLDLAKRLVSRLIRPLQKDIADRVRVGGGEVQSQLAGVLIDPDGQDVQRRPVTLRLAGDDDFRYARYRLADAALGHDGKVVIARRQLDGPADRELAGFRLRDGVDAGRAAVRPAVYEEAQCGDRMPLGAAGACFDFKLAVGDANRAQSGRRG